MLLTQVGISANAQKPLLDQTVLGTWPMIVSSGLSNDGKYATYSIETPGKGETFVTESTDVRWKMELTGISDPKFTDDSKRLIFIKDRKNLGICKLGTSEIKLIPNISAYTISPGEGLNFLAYQKEDSSRTLTLINLATDEEKSYTDVNGFIFSDHSRIMIILSDDHIEWINLINGFKKVISKTSKVSQFSFDESETKLVFLARNNGNGQNGLSLQYYQEAQDSTSELLSGLFTGTMKDMSFDEDGIYFNKDGNRICFKIKKTKMQELIQPDSSVGAKVNVKGFDGNVSQSSLDRESLLAVLDLSAKNNRVIFLQKKSETVLASDANKDWFVTKRKSSFGDLDIDDRNPGARPDIFLVSAKDGSKKILKKRLYNCPIDFSPTGKYLIWFDQDYEHWFAHNMILDKTIDITRMINVPFFQVGDYSSVRDAEELLGWLKDDSAVLIYDQNDDIWEVDPLGLKRPVNLTHGIAAKNNIRFHYINFSKYSPGQFNEKDTLLLSAFNTVTKEDGFYQLILQNGKLEKLVLSSNIYNFRGDDFCGVHSTIPIVKSRYTNCYLVTRMSTTEYPNLFFTENFHEFTPLTNLNPQKDYNWYTCELHHWILPNGKTGEGLLYKPENFDPRKKYPVIFYYYQKNAFNLHIYIHPELTQGTMSIPWFVSNGYLVFVPDIYYETGYPGRSALNSVQSAALYLSRNPWVDKKRMGLQGHSFGGFETNYIVTHSKLFAAAAPASGISDVISSYIERGSSYWENGQGRIGASLWERPDLYMENSAILKAYKVITPMLNMHTTDDALAPYSSQGLKWYNGLRLLGKKAWLLTYEGEDHELYNPKNQLDYSIRLSQFFDHYLKGAPPPKWMTEGGSSIELDTSGKKP